MSDSRRVRHRSRPSRRDFLKAGALGVGGLAIAFCVDGCGGGRSRGAPRDRTLASHGFLHVGRDGVVTVVIDKSEMGQGVVTSLAMLVAEELECPFDGIRTEFAPIDKRYNRLFAGSRVTAFGRLPDVGAQGTGGSSSMQSSWIPLRRAGAAARELFITAAASQWGLDRSECFARDGAIVHRPTGRRVLYRALVETAAALPVPDDPPLKPGGFRLIGTRIGRLDTPAKVRGTAVFGMDVRLPGMLVAVVERCPTFGGTVRSVDPSRALAVQGVRRVERISSGVAVVADATWPAMLGRRALDITWDDGPGQTVNSASISRLLAAAADRPGVVARRTGDPASAWSRAARHVTAEYEVPFLHTATMEPMNFTADVRRDACDLWGPTQYQSAAHAVAAEITGLAPEQVRVHTTYLGGGFGRRFEIDFVIDAVELSKAIGSPVQVVWSREDDIRHGFYRPAAYGRLGAALDAAGRPVAWTHRIVSPSILARILPEFVGNGLDPTSVEGAANIPYAIPNLLVDLVTLDTGIPVGSWRSTGNSQNGFITESFIDELAAAAAVDPLQYRLSLLPDQPRLRRVLELAAERAGWGASLPPGHAHGIAAVHSFDSFVAQVAEVSVSEAGVVRVHRVACAVDCGLAVNPDAVEAQMEGSIAFGLSAALREAITIDRGRVTQSNFHDYPVLRFREMPRIDVQVVPSTAAIGGAGEPGVPPIAPAVANAVFRATGVRVRKLPIVLSSAVPKPQETGLTQ